MKSKMVILAFLIAGNQAFADLESEYAEQNTGGASSVSGCGWAVQSREICYQAAVNLGLSLRDVKKAEIKNVKSEARFSDSSPCVHAEVYFKMKSLAKLFVLRSMLELAEHKIY